MTPTAFTWPYWPVFAATIIWAYLPESKIVRAAGKAIKHTGSRDKGSFQVIVYAGGIASTIAVAIAWLPFLRMSLAVRPIAFGFGIAAIVLGSLLRRHCFRVLGASFTGDVRAAADQRIVTTGAYRLLRHPSYTAGILMNIGFGFTLGNWASLLLLTLAPFAVYSYRIAVEERALLTVLGDPYRDFMRTRRRLVPFIY
ncbi:MAG TPA: isoprenylcysteine carboxylmethyltransferase family protein [Gemmatimonadales bacterium]|nr:isoprenylcysteine carboxylmethyltransferase family protein [Gemmatimonadales bacterium]